MGPDGRLFVVYQDNHRIRAIDLDSGVIETVSGNGEQGYAGDGGDAVDAELDRPVGVTFDADKTSTLELATAVARAMIFG